MTFVRFATVVTSLRSSPDVNVATVSTLACDVNRVIVAAPIPLAPPAITTRLPASPRTGRRYGGFRLRQQVQRTALEADRHGHRVDRDRVGTGDVLHAPPVSPGRGVVVARHGDFDMDPFAVGRDALRRIRGHKRRRGISAGGARDDGVAPTCQVGALHAEVVDVDTARENVVAARVVDVDPHEAASAGDVTWVPEIDANGEPGIVRGEPEQLHGEATAWASIKRGEEGHVVPG